MCIRDRKKIGVAIVLVFLIFLGVSCNSLKHSKTSFSIKQNEIYIDSMMTNALEKGFFPGAQMALGSKDSIFILKNYGYQDFTKKELVKTDDVYDLASMSKVLGATFVAMRLVGDKKINLKDKLGDAVAVYKNTCLLYTSRCV